MADMWQYEKEAMSYNYKLIAGIDEAGRGPLCGPVCAAAVILPFEVDIPGLNDSKKLTEKKREELYPQIIEKAVAYGVAFATPEEIDELNILNATFLAMRRAVDMLSVRPDILFVDGNRIRNQEIEAKLIVKGDSLSASIAAASIVAKVTRDRYMTELSEQYPEYMLSKHKGYPTAEHYEILAKYGVAPFYRKSFLKNIDRAKSKAEHGKAGEEAACRHLTEKGFEIVERNYRFKKSEIDIIAKKDNGLFAVEVKTRSSEKYGRPADFVTDAQQERIIEAARHYRAERYPEYSLHYDIIEVLLDSEGRPEKINRLAGGFC
ncbi:MAG: ribonuclease HII [Clostridia bacterium]|nr:ribonuclease HII [Clostridia bacterium]MBR2327857.1 ribonuclease HII [Clostridia bacterium]